MDTDIHMRELDENNVTDAHQVNGTFMINSALVLHLKDNILTYTVVDVPQYEKSYKKDDIDYTTYIDNPDKTIFFAYIGDTVTGQIIVRKNWNNYCYIEDIAVDSAFRHRGIGKSLLECAKKWAQKKGLAGIMLETQNNNVAGCKLYESCGFTLAGFDTHLYRGLKSDTDEIALYWYYLFEETVM